mgnify:CR=1 FL=1
MKIKKPSFATFQWIYWSILLIVELLFIMMAYNLVPSEGPLNALQIFIASTVVALPVSGVVFGMFIANGDVLTSWYVKKLHMPRIP